MYVNLCKDCSIELFGVDNGDLAELCSYPGLTDVLCNGCGWVWVDFTGRKVCECDPREGDPEYALRN